ncbi:MAG: T9SS type A sorting domain-containing protein [Bacteroidota bacterium]|nr:T9SS type A sorting domain-containing protein [Bacteroidota bacterium]
MRIVSVLIAVIIAQVVCAQSQTINNANSSSSQFTVINTGTSDYLLSISKINNNILISGGSSYLAQSYDNCNTLIPVNTPVFLETPENRYYKTYRVDTNYIYISYKTTNSNWKFFKTVDGGNNWIKKKDSTHSSLVYVEPVPLFYDTINASIIFSYNTALYTNNSLSTYTVGSWQPTWIGGVAVNIGTVISDSMAIFGENIYGGAYITKNRGNTWQQSTFVGGRVRDFEVINKDTIYYVSRTVPPNSIAQFGYTFDGGLTGPYIPITSPTYFTNITVKNKNEIYLVAREGAAANGNAVILKTTDLGQTWSKLTTPFVQDLRDMKFLNDSVALICGDSGLLVKWNTKQSLFVGVKENTTNNSSIKIYPNPTNDILNIDVDIINGNSSKLQILNSLGQIVREEKIKDPKSQINISQLPSGVYTLKVFIENEYKTFKIIKQ